MNNVLNFIKTKILIKEIVGPIVVILVSFILYKIIKKILRKFVDLKTNKLDAKRKKTLYYLFKSIIKILFVAIDILIILEICLPNSFHFKSGISWTGTYK